MFNAFKKHALNICQNFGIILSTSTLENVQKHQQLFYFIHYCSSLNWGNSYRSFSNASFQYLTNHAFVIWYQEVIRTVFLLVQFNKKEAVPAVIDLCKRGKPSYLPKADQDNSSMIRLLRKQLDSYSVCHNIT